MHYAINNKSENRSHGKGKVNVLYQQPQGEKHLKAAKTHPAKKVPGSDSFISRFFFFQILKE